MTASPPGSPERAREVARPLFWRPATDHPQDHGKWVADGISGRYSAEKEKDGTWLLWWAHDNFVWEACATFAECKEKAEADWQRRFAERLATPSPCGIESGGFLGPVLTKRIEAAFRNDSPPVASDGWLPIASAPKEPVGYRQNEFSPVPCGPALLLSIPWHGGTTTIGWWSPKANCWRHLLDDGPNDEQPTHWRPLPAPPTPDADHARGEKSHG